MKKEAAAVRIQTRTRQHQARKSYVRLRNSVVVVQTGLRSMDAHKRLRFRKQTKAATLIQVGNLFST